MPTPPAALDSLPRCTDVPPEAPPLEGYTFEGYKNADGSVGTRNLLGITATVQCVTGVLDHAVKRIDPQRPWRSSTRRRSPEEPVKTSSRAGR